MKTLIISLIVLAFVSLKHRFYSYENPYSFISKYAPIVYLDKNEVFYPSSINYFTDYTEERVVNGKTWLVSREKLKSPDDILDWFYGVKKLEEVPTYVLITPSLDEPYSAQAIKYPLEHDIVATYFLFYPYNCGKNVFGYLWGNHIGDIEYVHIFFKKGVPMKVVSSYHSKNDTRNWNDTVKEDGHVVVYSALGSHGLWFESGNHIYHTKPELIDYTSRGESWKTWEYLSLIKPNVWGSSYDLAKIWRLGNPSSNCYFGYCRLEDGTLGFLGKGYLQKIVKKLEKDGILCRDGCLWSAGVFS